MAKKKANTNPPKIIRIGIPVPLIHPEIPDEWMPADDYSSHRPMLYRAATNLRHGAFYEFGTGYGSTPLLQHLYLNEFPERELISVEADQQWFEIAYSMKYEPFMIHEGVHWHKYKNHILIKTDTYLSRNIFQNSLAFIDSAPGEERKALISKHSVSAKAIIVHDTEPGAEYVYGMADILKSFNFRCDLVCEGMPQTTIVSNRYDFKEWAGIVNDKIQFVCE